MTSPSSDDISVENMSSQQSIMIGWNKPWVSASLFRPFLTNDNSDSTRTFFVVATSLVKNRRKLRHRKNTPNQQNQQGPVSSSMESTTRLGERTNVMASSGSSRGWYLPSFVSFCKSPNSLLFARLFFLHLRNKRSPTRRMQVGRWQPRPKIALVASRLYHDEQFPCDFACYSRTLTCLSSLGGLRETGDANAPSKAVGDTRHWHWCDRRIQPR